MTEDVKVIAYDSTRSPNSVSRTLHNTKFSFYLDTDVKVFDLGTFATLMDDLFGGLKIPNYIIDNGRAKKVWKLDFQLVEGIDGDDQNALEKEAWDLAEFFEVTCYKYRYIKLEAGDEITFDYADAVGSGVEAIFCRVRDFSFTSAMNDQGKIDCSLTLLMGRLVRLFD